MDCSCGRRHFLIGAGAAGLFAGTAHAAGKPRRIDVHHHVTPPGWLEAVKRVKLDNPPMALWTPEKSLDDMDKAGITTSLVSPTTPQVGFLPPADAAHVAGAPVVVVLYSDFQCPHCREEAKMLRANLIQTFSKEVRAYFRDFPIDTIHNWAKPAAIAGRCVYREDQAKFWDFHRGSEEQKKAHQHFMKSSVTISEDEWQSLSKI